MAEFDRLEDVEMAALENPGTFFLPSEDERRSRRIGDSVRLHFLLKEPAAGEPRAEMNRFIEIGLEFGSPLHDPQAGVRHDEGGGTGS